MKWRIREGHGEAIYEIGVEDDGALAGLQINDMAASLQTLKEMAVKLGATCSVLRERTLDNGRQVAEVLVRKVNLYPYTCRPLICISSVSMCSLWCRFLMISTI